MNSGTGAATAILLLSLIAVIAMGCGGECIRHSDCPNGLVCVAGECALKSDLDAAVDSGPDCDSGDCPDDTDTEEDAGSDADTDSDTDTDADAGTDSGIDGGGAA